MSDIYFVNKLSVLVLNKKRFLKYRKLYIRSFLLDTLSMKNTLNLSFDCKKYIFINLCTNEICKNKATGA